MGAIDAIVRVEFGVIRVVTITEQKDAEAGAPISFALESIVPGMDDEGNPVEAAIVHYLKAPVIKDLAKGPALLHLALIDAIEAAGKPVSEGKWRDG